MHTALVIYGLLVSLFFTILVSSWLISLADWYDARADWQRMQNKILEGSVPSPGLD